MGRRAVLTAALALAVAGVAIAAAPRVTLPRDHAGHRAGIEWWYLTGVVRGDDGARYSIFFTLFKRAGFLLPVSQVLDLDTGALVGHTETVAKATVGSTLNVHIPGARLRYVQATNSWSLAAGAAGYALTLTAVPQKRYVLHGNHGYISQSVAGPSAYYSATRMTARGTITAGGKTIPFSGETWLDHQWGNFAADPRAFNWDWFSCRFDDRTELMLYRFRRSDGTPLAAYRSGTLVLRDGRTRAVRGFEIAAGERTLDAAGRRWPLDWQLLATTAGIDVRLTSIVADQLVRGTVLPTFYEGAATATGSKAGLCFVEQSYGQ
jgi:predicted secreted hydrolase